MEPTLQTLASLRATFGMPGVLDFEQRGDLLCAKVHTPSASAIIALQGAHLVHWQPTGEAPVLFLSERSEFTNGKAIRGGIPVIWPWFGPRTETVGPRTAAVASAPADAPTSPSHGFARTQVWTLQFAASVGEDLHLTFTLAPSAESRALGFDGFRLAYQIAIGRELTVRLTAGNDGHTELRYEEALHTYFAVSDAARIAVHGLEGAEFLDKTDAMQRKRQPEAPLHFIGSTDRIYLATEAPCTLVDEAAGRSIHIAKLHSRNTVVWNPWAELTPGLPDMAPEGWRTMLCVETVNAGEEAILLHPGEAHTMGTRLSITHLPASQPKEK